MKLAPSWQPALAEAPAPKTSAIILESDFPRKWRGLKILKVGSNAFYLSMHKLFIDIALLRHNLSARPSASCTQPYNNLMFQFTLRNPERRQVFPRCFFKTVDNVVKFGHRTLIPPIWWVLSERFKTRPGDEPPSIVVHNKYDTSNRA